MAGATLKIDMNAAAFAKLIGWLDVLGADMEPAMAEIGETLLIAHAARWRREEAPDGTPWAPLLPATVRQKPRNKNRILRLDGHLAGLLRYQAAHDGLEFGTNRIYGATHQFGDESRGIVARPFLGVASADERSIADILMDHIGEP